MILVLPKGRFGNHIFIYHFVYNNTKKNEIIITTQSDFFKYFDFENRRVIILNNIFYKIIVKFIHVFGFLFRRVYCNTEFSEQFKITSQTKIIEKKGIINSLKIYDGYFQSYFVKNKKLNVKRQNVSRVYLRYSYLFNNKEKLIFIHQRNGDYKSFTAENKNVWLKNSYYKNALDIIGKNDKIHYLVFTDDKNELHESIIKLINKTIIEGQNAIDDFILMTLCNGGIISNSTFSYCAAELIKSPLYLIAPKYWLGWKSKKWIPYGIKNPNFIYVDAEF